MSGETIGVVFGGIGVLVAALAWLTTRRSARDVREIGEAANHIHQSNLDLDMMAQTISVLRGNLDDAEERVERMQIELKGARRQVDQLNREITVARINTDILTRHIVEHIPDVPFPRLQRVNGGQSGGTTSGN